MQPQPNLIAIYDLLVDAVMEANTDKWTIARLNVQFLADGEDVEFYGNYLDEAGESQVLSTDFPGEVTEAMQQLYKQRETNGDTRANQLQMDLTSDGRFTTAFDWDQELQDEDEHFANGGTVKTWQAIREAKYGVDPDGPPVD